MQSFPAYTRACIVRTPARALCLYHIQGDIKRRAIQMNERVENKRGCDILSEDVRLNRRNMQQEKKFEIRVQIDAFAIPHAREAGNWAPRGGDQTRLRTRARCCRTGFNSIKYSFSACMPSCALQFLIASSRQDAQGVFIAECDSEAEVSCF